MNENQIAHTESCAQEFDKFCTVISVAFPVLFTSIGNVLINLVADELLAEYDTSLDSSLNTIFNFQMFIFITFTAELYIVGPLISELLGKVAHLSDEKNEEDSIELSECHLLIQQTYLQGLLAVFISSGSIMLIFSFSEDLFLLFGESETTSALAQEYFDKLNICVPFYVLLMHTQQTVLGLSGEVFSAIISTLSFGLFFGVAYAGVNGYINIFDNDIDCIAYTYAFVYALTATVYVFYLLLNNQKVFFKNYDIDNQIFLGQFQKIMLLGSPLVLSLGAELGAFFMLVIIAENLSAADNIVQNITTQFIYISLNTLVALSITGSLLVAYAIGKKSYVEARDLGNWCLKTGVLVNIFFLFIAAFLSSQIAALYLADDDIMLPYMRTALILTAVGQFFDGAANISMGNLRGREVTTVPTILDALPLWCISVPLAYVLGVDTDLTILGIVIGDLIGLIIRAIPLLILWNQESLRQEASENLSICAYTNSFFSTPYTDIADPEETEQFLLDDNSEDIRSTAIEPEIKRN